MPVADEATATAPKKKRALPTTTAESAAKRTAVDGTKDLFQPDPQYGEDYNAQGQVDVYGAKRAVDPPRPPVEIGRQQYTSGSYDESSTLLGEKNPLLPGLAVYGDWRTAVAYNGNNGKDIAQIATRLNLDVDLKLTGTERVHAFFTPIQENNNKFTRFEFGGGDGDEQFNGEFDLDPQTLFFEGDFGSLYSGVSGQEASFDLPFTVGLFPLFLQNGIWANDAILGGAVSLPAKELGGTRPRQLRRHLLRRVRQCRQRRHHREGRLRQSSGQPLWRHGFYRRLQRLHRSWLRPDPGPRRAGRAADALPDRRLQPALSEHLVEFDPRVRELRRRP